MTLTPDNQIAEANEPQIAPANEKQPLPIGLLLLITAFVLIITVGVVIIIVSNTGSKATSKNVSGKIGDSLALNGYIITAHRIEKAASYGNSGPARDGYVYLAVEITIQSDKDKNVQVSGSLASLKDDLGNIYYDVYWKEPYFKLQENLPKGEKVRAWFTFMVPQTAKSFTLEYRTPFINGPNIISFALQ